MNRIKKYLILIGTFILSFSNHSVSQVIQDIDGNNYSTVVIGNYVWMVENLKTTRYNNGDPIPLIELNGGWSSTENGAYSWYNNNNVMDVLYGKLYNGYTVLDERNVCPIGWRIPSDFEWREMLFTLCESQDCEALWLQGAAQSDWIGTNEGGKVKSVNDWESPNVGADNSSGLNILPSGYRYFDGNCYTFGFYSNLWSRTALSDSINMWFWAPINNRSDIYHGNGDLKNGNSIRCITDAFSGVIEYDKDFYQFHPNPAYEGILLTTSEEGVKNVIITNVSGQIMFSDTFTSTKFVYNLVDLPAGIYQISLQSSNKTYTKKLVKI